MVFKSHDEFSKSSLYDRVKKLLVSYEWSDCCFSLSGKDFKAHKLILGISSPVFEAMLYGPLSSSNNIVITDIEPDIFQLLLNYIYTDKVKLTSIEEAFELLYAARKYLLEELIQICVSYIQANMSIDNVISVLNYPEFMQDKLLISSAQKLFCEHANYLLQTNKKNITFACMQTVLQSNEMNISEKDLIKHVFDWVLLYCDQRNLQKSIGYRREILIKNGLLKLLRFFTLNFDELNEIVVSPNNLLLAAESVHITQYIMKISNIDRDMNLEKTLGENFKPRSPLKLQWNLCHRSPIYSTSPINIDANNYMVHSRIKVNKSIFITSLCIPTRMAPVLNFRNNTSRTYSEQISVSVIDESEDNVVKFTNFMNTVDYDSMVDIELSEPCFITKDKWYKVTFAWPQNHNVTYSYLVEYRESFYEDHKVSFDFEDLNPPPGLCGSLLCGLKYCL